MFMFLDETTAAAATTNSLSSILQLVIPLVLVAVVFYFFLLRPQKKQEKQANEMRNNLEVGDEITTIGGVIGRVTSIKDETFTIETSRDGTKIRFLRSALKSIDVKAEDSVADVKKPVEKK